MDRPVIFLDDGGVLNDNRRRGPQWQRHVADFLAPRLGGYKRDWRLANAVVSERLFRDMSPLASGTADHSFWAAPERYLEEWLAGMCRELALDPPASATQRLALAQEAAAYVTRRVHAAIPGAIPAIRLLQRRGYTLHTASGEYAADLDGYLEGMGVRACFGTLYGCDLIGVAKSGPGYYERLFQHARVEPAQALVVDDTERALDWAAAIRACTVLCGSAAPAGSRHSHVGRLADLPALLVGLEPKRGAR
jgi:HAD superfamily hydrolase (TIGR01509 family)